MAGLKNHVFGAVVSLATGLLCTTSSGAVYISEAMANNGATLADADGDFPDWIELYNPSLSAVSLNGWYLSDDTNALTKWQLPDTNLSANSFLIIFASDKDRAVAGGELHTNFKLSSSGEPLVLTQADGVSIQNRHSLPELEQDQSFGYEFIGGEISLSATGLLAAPTPGAVNTNIAYEGLVETPVVLPGRGFYNTPVQVSVSNITDGATVRYTLDGSEPTESSTLYSGPIAISATTNLRVRAFRTNWKPSFPRTDSYIFLDDVVTQPKSIYEINGQAMNVGMDTGVVAKTYYDSSNQVVTVQDALKATPTLSITTDYDNLFGITNGIYVNATQRWERAASAELIYPDGSEGFHINAGLRLRGGWSRHSNYPKHSFRLFFRSEYGESKLNYPLFEDEGVNSFDKIDLRSAQNYNWVNGNDIQKTKNSFVRDVICRDAAGAMGNPYPRSRYYHLYLNGRYWGLFMTEERPVADFAESYLGGDQEDYDAIKVTSWTDELSYTIEATDGTTNAYYRMYEAAMRGFTNNADYFAIQGLGPDGQPDPTEERLLDLENMLDYLLIIYYAGASDNGLTAFGNNTKLNNIYAVYNRENPDGFKWLQHDCEHAFDTSTSLDRTGPFNHPNFTLARYFNAQTFHEKLSVNAEYRIAFADRVYKHLKNNGVLTADNMAALMDFRAAQIDRAIVANAARWGSTSLDRDMWLTAIDSVRGFFPGRADIVIGYLREDGLIPSIEPPHISLPDGPVADGTAISLSAAEGTIYYTTDGSDPRAIGGTISGQHYLAPVHIHEPVQIKARVLKPSGEWSALLEAEFWTPTTPLAITELMYHAPGGNPHEFIELRNISDQTIMLDGYKFDNAIDFKFRHEHGSLAPGEYIVVVDDLAAFSTVYPASGLRIAGEYSGNFSNGGERIDLEFRNNDLISFTYSDARNWPQAADGAGHSLVPLESAMTTQESGSLDYGGNWRASSYTNGSPGTADPILGKTVALNEITAHTDTGLTPPFDSNDQIELYNPTAVPVDLSGWSLSDDPNDRSKFIIPNGTTIPAGGFILFDEDDFHPERADGFGLNKAGEQVYLFDPARGVVDAIRFKGQENGAALGRYPDGSNHWITTLPTAGSTNTPYELPFGISEVMYHPLPPAGPEMEYIVIENSAGASAPLENSVGPYRIDGGVNYTFPAGVSLAADEKVRLVPFDPAVDTFLAAQFRSLYGLSPTDPLLGPYQGQLSNGGERIGLERPQASDDPLRPDDVSWVVIDELYHFDQAPWPASADGGGHPLIRTGRSSWSVPFTPGISVSEPSLYKRLFAGQAPVESTLQIRNSALSTLNYSLSSDVPWLTALPSSGSSTGELDSITLDYDTTGLAAGSYTGQLSVAAAGAFNSPQSIEVVMEVYEQLLDHLSWETPGTGQTVDQPFSVSVSARDQYGAVISSFTDSASVTGLEGGIPPPEINLGAESTQWDYPLSTSSHDARTQSIYLNTEIGFACTITSLAINVTSIPGQLMENWTIRMRHTPLSGYGEDPVWENTWTTVYQHDTTISATGWTVFELDSPFIYNGTDNLMIDFSFNNSDRSFRGYCVSTTGSEYRSLYYRTSSRYGDPLDWAGTSGPTPRRNTKTPDLRLGCLIDNRVSISPAATGNFVHGTWSGMITIHEEASGVVLYADDGNNLRGASIPLDSAVHPDADGDGLPDTWETAFFGHPSSCIITADSDLDGHDNLQEYLTGMDPTNAASHLTTELGEQLPGGFVVHWNPVEGRTYDVLWSPDLAMNFQILEPAIPYPVNSYTDRVHSVSAAGYYRVKARVPSDTDYDGDGLPDSWESGFFRHPVAAMSGSDADGDGQSNFEEYLAGTIPTNAASLFKVDSLSAQTLYWTGKPGRTYSVYWTDDLENPFILKASGITGGSYIDSAPTNGSGFYRITVDMP